MLSARCRVRASKNSRALRKPFLGNFFDYPTFAIICRCSFGNSGHRLYFYYRDFHSNYSNFKPRELINIILWPRLFFFFMQISPFKAAWKYLLIKRVFEINANKTSVLKTFSILKIGELLARKKNTILMSVENNKIAKRRCVNGGKGNQKREKKINPTYAEAPQRIQRGLHV